MRNDIYTAVRIAEAREDYEDLADHLHALVEGTLAAGLCPRCLADLDDDGFCVMCGATFRGPEPLC